MKPMCTIYTVPTGNKLQEAASLSRKQPFSTTCAHNNVENRNNDVERNLELFQKDNKYCHKKVAVIHRGEVHYDNFLTMWSLVM